MKADDESIEPLVRALAHARDSGTQLRGADPSWSLRDAREAERAMLNVAQHLGWERLGWKIAATNAAMQQRLGTTHPVFGVTFARHLHASPACLPAAGLMDPVVECEFFFRMGRDLPARDRPYGFDEVADAVADVHIGIEIGECRFAADCLPGPLFLMADGFGSGRYVAGARLGDWRSILQRPVAVTLQRNGIERGRGSSADVMGHPLAPVVWLSTQLQGLGQHLRTGELISSGSCNIMARGRAGDRFVARFDGIGEVLLELA